MTSNDGIHFFSLFTLMVLTVCSLFWWHFLHCHKFCMRVFYIFIIAPLLKTPWLFHVTNSTPQLWNGSLSKEISITWRALIIFQWVKYFYLLISKVSEFCAIKYSGLIRFLVDSWHKELQILFVKWLIFHILSIDHEFWDIFYF